MKRKKERTLAEELLDMPHPAGDHVRIARRFESEKVAAEAKLRAVEERLRQAEQDLSDATKREQLLLATQSEPARKQFSAMEPKPGGSATAIVCLTDWHVEETVDAAVVNHLNEFDLKIADRRIEKTFAKAARLVDFARKLSVIDDAVVWLGGDFITGYIHEELEESNSLSPVEAINWLQDRIFNGLRFLSKELRLKNIRVICNHGNHGRTTKKKRISTRARNSFEWLAYNTLAKFCRLDNLTSDWTIAAGYHVYCSIQKHNVRFHHGDSIKYGGGVGGITIPVNKAVSQWNKAKRASLDVFGHWHQYIEQWNWVSVGCLIGHSPFAIEIKADFQPPTQAVLVVDKDYEKVLCMPVFCQGVDGGK